MGSLPLALRWSLLGSLWQEAAVSLAALCRCGRCGGPRRWSFSAGARAGPPVARSARHASMLLALPDRGSPWEPSRDCLPDEIADERVADGARVGGSVAGFTVKKDNKRWDDDRLLWSQQRSAPLSVWAGARAFLLFTFLTRAPLRSGATRPLHQLPAHQRSRQGNSPCSAPTVSPLHGGARSSEA